MSAQALRKTPARDGSASSICNELVSRAHLGTVPCFLLDAMDMGFSWSQIDRTIRVNFLTSPWTESGKTATEDVGPSKVKERSLPKAESNMNPANVSRGCVFCICKALARRIRRHHLRLERPKKTETALILPPAVLMITLTVTMTMTKTMTTTMTMTIMMNL